MTDHHDYGDHHFGDDHLPFDDHDQFDHDQFGPHHDDPGPPDDHLAWEPPVPEDHHVELPAHDQATLDEHLPRADEHPATDLPDLPDLSDNVFPPAVDVGELPEPVDGFPWIDTGSLGLADLRDALHETDPVQPAELAEYARTDLPAGADPWQALADSDDPATAALAKWWSQQN
ncbi:hypothetical protein GCM10010172_05420 [Paractinoplanes ferrugineus]|uniref:Uncharacterized protein n=1 Tax=Paractinoplanes ferrugineus TaxID=113564 RepID=A0A919MAG2_9ACTN|nr:hypothetical protein [Actinoplanes ferrugineus]GIE12541.1 hypothetical protein Afe05nite_43810 [Actinoplanes ferrugineus]